MTAADIKDDDNKKMSLSVFTPESSEYSTTKNELKNFVAMSISVSINHGSVASCLALVSATFNASYIHWITNIYFTWRAIPKLGNIGAIQSGILYLAYTASSILGATYVSKSLGARNALRLGMALYCIYVGCFLFATLSVRIEAIAAVLGALIGGIGGGFLWTAQGSYFAFAAERYASSSQIPVSNATSFLGGIFAFIYLTCEVSLKALSTAMIESGFTWSSVFVTYFVVAILATILMRFVHNYENEKDDNRNERETTVIYKMMAAGRLFMKDPKVRYMSGINVAFGLSASFMASYVGATFEPKALHDDDAKYVGALSATTSCVAAIFSFIFGILAQKPVIGKGPILISGTVFFFLVGFSFTIVPDPMKWGLSSLIMVYSFQGLGRATYESTLRATFADMFPSEKEGAFANIILQNGLSSTFGYFFSPFISPIAFVWILMMSSVLGMLGYLRAFNLQRYGFYESGSMSLVDNNEITTDEIMVV